MWRRRDASDYVKHGGFACGLHLFRYASLTIIYAVSHVDPYIFRDDDDVV